MGDPKCPCCIKEIPISHVLVELMGCSCRMSLSFFNTKRKPGSDVGQLGIRAGDTRVSHTSPNMQW